MKRATLSGGLLLPWAMHQLSPSQRTLVASLTEQLSAIERVEAVVLGGSHARGRARPESDIDLGIFYREASPFSLEVLRALSERVNDASHPVMTGFYEWGPWVNGGAWLTIGGQRVDFLYRSLDQIELVIREARAGRCDHSYAQQPPFGFYADTYLADIQSCVPLFDPQGAVARAKRDAAEYPEALRRELVQSSVGGVGMDLYATRNAARLGDAYLTASCSVRTINRLVQALYALNRRYRVNDKTALLELDGAEHLPADFGARVQALSAHLGANPEALSASVEALARLVEEVRALSAGVFTVDEESPAWLKSLKQAGL